MWEFLAVLGFLVVPGVRVLGARYCLCKSFILLVGGSEGVAGNAGFQGLGSIGMEIEAYV